MDPALPEDAPSPSPRVPVHLQERPCPRPSRRGARPPELPLPSFAATTKGRAAPRRRSSARAALPEKARLCRGSGFSSGAFLPALRAPRRAGRPSLPLRPAGARRSQTRPPGPARLGSARLRGRGAHSAVAPTLWPFGPQRAAPGSARAGGGCYARNVRVSGPPSGSKRTTNNLSAAPPSSALRLLPLPPPGPRLPPGRRCCWPGAGRPLSSAPGTPRALQDALPPLPAFPHNA